MYGDADPFWPLDLQASAHNAAHPEETDGYFESEDLDPISNPFYSSGLAFANEPHQFWALEWTASNKENTGSFTA